MTNPVDKMLEMMPARLGRMSPAKLAWMRAVCDEPVYVIRTTKAVPDFAKVKINGEYKPCQMFQRGGVNPANPEYVYEAVPLDSHRYEFDPID